MTVVTPVTDAVPGSGAISGSCGTSVTRVNRGPPGGPVCLSLARPQTVAGPRGDVADDGGAGGQRLIESLDLTATTWRHEAAADGSPGGCLHI